MLLFNPNLIFYFHVNSKFPQKFDNVYRKRLKKNLLSTPQYIYQALFIDGIDSDITLVALEKEWKLHKVYLCQSPYFSSMFSGSWKEANESVVHIKIIDPKITIDCR